MRPRMLIAEGDHAWRRGLRVLFSNRGWEVTSASTVVEGLALLDAPLDFLILDWALPDTGGGIILRRVRDIGGSPISTRRPRRRRWVREWGRCR